MYANRHTLANALRVAAEVYDADAQSQDSHAEQHRVAGKETSGILRVRDQFREQAHDARKLAASIEEADTITLQD